MLRKRMLIASIFLVAGIALAIADDQPGPAPSGNVDPRFAAGVAAFSAEKYQDALDSFEALLSDPKADAIHPDAAYWSVLTYLALGDQASAEKAIDAYLQSWPTGERMPDLIYQLGRIQYARGDFENALRSFSSFIAASPTHDLVPSAFYWSGECLYSLGRLEDADKVFGTVIDRYPSSVKVEAAEYRRELISLAFREQELLKLLAWSHEESLSAAADFRQKEKDYESALEAYRKQASSAQEAQASPVTANQTQPVPPAPPASPAPEAAVAAPAPGDGALLASALDSKRRALDLLAFYLDRLSQGGKQ